MPTDRARNRASRTAVALAIQAASPTPEPRVVASTGSIPVTSDTSAAVGVDTPTPQTAPISRSAPPSTSASAIARPPSKQASSSSSDIASSRSMRPELDLTRCARSTGVADRSAATAMSTVRTTTPAACASGATGPAPAARSATRRAVSVGG